jgi:hypothetical protein
VALHIFPPTQSRVGIQQGYCQTAVQDSWSSLNYSAKCLKDAKVQISADDEGGSLKECFTESYDRIYGEQSSVSVNCTFRFIVVRIQTDSGIRNKRLFISKGGSEFCL